jgi:hypothetical protein
LHFSCFFFSVCHHLFLCVYAAICQRSSQTRKVLKMRVVVRCRKSMRLFFLASIHPHFGSQLLKHSFLCLLGDMLSSPVFLSGFK